MATTAAANEDGIALAEYQQRRAAVLKGLKDSAAVVFSGEGSAPLVGKWRPDSNFFYLTGLENEGGAAVLFDPSAESPKRRCVLFLRPVNPERDRWDGYREQIGLALKARTGFEAIARSDGLAGALTGAARRCKTLSCLHPFAVYPGNISPDMDVFRKISERVPGVTIEDRVNLLPSLRAVKSPAELSLIRKAISITAAGYAAAVKVIRPGASEEDVAQALEITYRRQGARALAFNTIAGAGLNSTVLHYMDNTSALQKSDMLVVDSGAEYGHYAADVTRTFPVGGRFTPEQREVYEVVLQAQAAAIKAARVGVKMTVVDEAARKVIDKAGYADAFCHGIGHQLGIQVHDATPDGPLKAGMVVTIEPGVYLPDRKIGVRIEDDVLITRRGAEVLTAAIPKTVADVEAALR
ncbi:MAG TPA: Xaa-Pro peptidase family protein [Planctomycetota bacterium]|jgi:Xaa-Pro aminopeptidase